MITKLTPEQEALIPIVRDEWINECLKPHQITQEEAEEAVKWYLKIGKIREKYKVVVLDSPSQIYSQIRSQIDSQILSQIDSQIYFYDRQSLFYWAGYCGFYSFFERIGVLKSELFAKWSRLIKFGILYLFFTKGTAYIIRQPTILRRDARNRLHSTTDMAVEWGDGTGLYFIDGVAFDPQTWKSLKEKSITPQKAITLKNIEQRTVALKLMGYGFIVNALGAKSIDTFKTKDSAGRQLEYVLYEIDLKDDDVPARFLKVQWYDKTTDRTPKETILRVNPRECKPTCESARAWTFNLKEIKTKVET